MSSRVLIVGGYGVFGGRLAIALSQQDSFHVIVAGRSLSKAEKFCAGTRCRPLALDTSANNLDQLVTGQNPDIVIDAAGPFQGYVDHDYAVARAAINCGAHYLDLSDDAEFTVGISRLNERARKADVAVLSGVSSVPALSSVVVGALAEDMSDLHLIESAIMPGNRAPRGQSVVRAIVGQVGCDIAVWRDGKVDVVKGWSGSKTYELMSPDGQSVAQRSASFIGAPDLKLFPDYFGARSVLFRAGLDLKLMHAGLWLLSLLVRMGAIKSLSPLASLLKRAADIVEPFGSDIGGMVVTVEGKTEAGNMEARHWILIARNGDGPNIPIIPAQIMCQKLLSGDIETGARPCLEAFTLKDADVALAEFAITTSVQSTSSDLLFKTAIGERFEDLPDPIVDLHTVLDIRRWTGRACIKRGGGILSRLAGWMAGFPPASDDVSVTVEMQRTPQGETWVRKFGKNTFQSHLTARVTGDGRRLYERFGWLKFKIELRAEGGKLHYPVSGGRLLGIPLPNFLLPTSSTHEHVDDKGRACFDVEISLPVAGHVASYQGWLCESGRPKDEDQRRG